MKKINIKALAALLVLCLTLAAFVCACVNGKTETEDTSESPSETPEIIGDNGDENGEGNESDEDDGDKKPVETQPSPITTDSILSDADMPTLGWNDTAEQ